jgi:hypothetical protein
VEPAPLAFMRLWTPKAAAILPVNEPAPKREPVQYGLRRAGLLRPLPSDGLAVREPDQTPMEAPRKLESDK